MAWSHLATQGTQEHPYEKTEHVFTAKVYNYAGWLVNDLGNLTSNLVTCHH